MELWRRREELNPGLIILGIPKFPSGLHPVNFAANRMRLPSRNAYFQRIQVNALVWDAFLLVRTESNGREASGMTLACKRGMTVGRKR